MKNIEKSLFEGFIDDILGSAKSSIGGSGYDAEAAASAEFEQKFLQRGQKAFNSAWKSDGIDLNKSGISSAAPVATAATLGLNPSGQPIPAPAPATPVATAAGLGLTPSGQPVAQAAPQTAQQGQQTPAQPAASPNINMTYQGKPAAGASSNLIQPTKAQPTQQPGLKYSTTIPAKPTAAAQQPAAAPAQSATQAAPAQKRTGGRVKGYLSTNPRAVARRQANAAKKGAPTKQPTAQAQAPAQPKAAGNQPISIGGQKLNPKNPEHAKLIQKVQTAAKPRARYNPKTKKYDPVQEAYILSLKEFKEDKKLQTLNSLFNSIMLSEASSPNGISPSEFMWDIITQQMRGMDLEKHPNHKKNILSLLTRWENALKKQVQSSQGEFKGFQGDTKEAFNDLAELLSSIAFASLSPTKQQGRRTP